MCVCVCVCARARARVCVCVCVCPHRSLCCKVLVRRLCRQRASLPALVVHGLDQGVEGAAELGGGGGHVDGEHFVLKREKRRGADW